MTRARIRVHQKWRLGLLSFDTIRNFLSQVLCFWCSSVATKNSMPSRYANAVPPQTLLVLWSYASSYACDAGNCLSIALMCCSLVQVDAGVKFVKKQARRLSHTSPTARKSKSRRATLEEID